MEQPIFMSDVVVQAQLLRLMLNQVQCYISLEKLFFCQNYANNKNYMEILPKPYQRWFLSAIYKPTKATSKSFSFPVFELTLEEAETAYENSTYRLSWCYCITV